jgi:tRNA(Ile)-lysidine synthetase-like protein
LLHCILAVSGGIDSMVMLHAAWNGNIVPVDYHFKWTVAHFDHKLRPDSSKDAELVKEQAEKLGIACVLGQPKHAYNAKTDGNVEAWARRQRYSFLEQVRIDVKANFVCTAHTSNDVIEGLLIKLVANKEMTYLHPLDSARNLVRPLWEVSRQEIIQFADQYGINFSEDPTNQSMERTRNKIRHKILPKFREQFGQNVDEQLKKQAIKIHETTELVREWARERLFKAGFDEVLIVGSQKWKHTLERAIAAAPELLRWRIVEEALLPLINFRLGEKHSQRAVIFFLSNSSEIQLPRVTLRRYQGDIICEEHYGKSKHW